MTPQNFEVWCFSGDNVYPRGELIASGLNENRAQQIVEGLTLRLRPKNCPLCLQVLPVPHGMGVLPKVRYEIRNAEEGTS